MSLRSGRTAGRVADCLMRERDFPTSVRPERRPKAGVEGPAMAAHDASTPRPAAAALSANGWGYVAALSANGWEYVAALSANDWGCRKRPLPCPQYQSSNETPTPRYVARWL